MPPPESDFRGFLRLLLLCAFTAWAACVMLLYVSQFGAALKAISGRLPW